MAFKEIPSKTARQKVCLKLYKEAGFGGTLEAATGFGKTHVAIMFLLRLFAFLNYTPKVLVVVDSSYLRDQWYEELGFWKIEGIDVKIINTVIKSKHVVDLLILDEIHGYVAEKFGMVFHMVTYKWILGLTATIDIDDEKNAIIAARCPIFDVVPLSECRENGWVSEFTVYNLALSLSPVDRIAYDKASKQFNIGFAIFNHQFPLMMSCLSNRSDAEEHAVRLYKDPTRYGEIMGAARRANGAMQRRKDILYNARIKVETAVQLAGMFPNKKILYFSQSTQMAEDVNDGINDAWGEISVSYHSEVKGEESKTERTKTGKPKRIGSKDVRKNRIQRLLRPDDSIRILSAAKALDQGADIDGIDMGCITSGNSTQRQTVQRIGRIIRYKDNKHAIIVDLYINDTQDFKWLKSRQKMIPKNCIRWISNIKDVI